MINRTYVVVPKDENAAKKAKQINEEFHFHPQVALEALLSKVDDAFDNFEKRTSWVSLQGGKLEALTLAYTFLLGCLDVLGAHRVNVREARDAEKRTAPQSKLLRTVSETWVAADKVLNALDKGKIMPFDELPIAFSCEQLTHRVRVEIELTGESESRLVSWKRKHAQALRRIGAVMLEQARQEEKEAIKMAVALPKGDVNAFDLDVVVVTDPAENDSIDPQLAERDAELRDGYVRGR